MRNVSKTTTTILGSARAGLFLILSVVNFMSKDWFVAILSLLLSIAAIVVIYFHNESLRKNQQHLWMAFLTIVFASSVGGATYLLWNPKDTEPQKRQRFNFRGSLSIPYVVFMVLFVVLPLLLIVYYAFTDGNDKFSLMNWKTVFTDPLNWQIIGRTFIIAAVTTILCIVIAYPIAMILSNKKYNKNAVLVYIFLLPMWINFVIRTVGLKALLIGLSKNLFGFDVTAQYPYLSIVIGMVYDYLPFAILPLYNQMLKMDKNQIEAAADLGANPIQVLYKAIIPMTIPGIISAATMTFMPTMSSYVIANKMSNRTKSIIGNLIQAYFGESLTANSNHIGSVLSLVMLAIIGLSIVVEKLFDKKEERKTKGIW